MNKLILLLTTSLLLLPSLANAVPGEQVIAAGQTKTVTLNLVGAPMASAVSVSGRGITARITRREATKLHVRLQARNNTKGGLRSINVVMPAGLDKTNLFVFDIANARARVSGSDLAGQYQRVDLDVHSQTQKLLIQASPGCSGSKNGSFTTRDAGPGYFPVTKNGLRRSFWVTRPSNKNGSCVMRIEELSIHEKTRSGAGRTPYYKEVTLNFRRDDRFPDSLEPPRILSPDQDVSTTRTSRGSSPELRWQRMSRKPTAYIIYYGTNASRLNLNKKVNSRTLKTQLDNLATGEYIWRISSVFEAGFDTALSKKVVSDPSVPRRFTLRQVN